MSDIKVSVICNTYNHGDYIRDALEGFVMQKTDFAYEVLVHDDASTDNTAEIIRQYEEKYPDIIKPICQIENQHSQKIPITTTYQLPRAQGKYIALCEGDDYWTDPLKLQKQYDAMEAHPEVDICAHAAFRVDQVSGEECLISPSETERILTAEEVIRGGGGFVMTASLFYRKSLDEKMPEFRKIRNFDYSLQMHGALRGGMYFLNDTMSVYRWHVPGSWTMRVELNLGVEKRKYVEQVNSVLRQLDIDTDNKFSEIIDYKIRKNEFFILAEEERHRELLTDRYKRVFKDQKLSNRVKIRISAYFPWLRKLYIKLRGRDGK